MNVIENSFVDTEGNDSIESAELIKIQRRKKSKI